MWYTRAHVHTEKNKQAQILDMSREAYVDKNGLIQRGRCTTWRANLATLALLRYSQTDLPKKKREHLYHSFSLRFMRVAHNPKIEEGLQLLLSMMRRDHFIQHVFKTYMTVLSLKVKNVTMSELTSRVESIKLKRVESVVIFGTEPPIERAVLTIQRWWWRLTVEDREARLLTDVAHQIGSRRVVPINDKVLLAIQENILQKLFLRHHIIDHVAAQMVTTNNNIAVNRVTSYRLIRRKNIRCRAVRRIQRCWRLSLPEAAEVLIKVRATMSSGQILDLWLSGRVYYSLQSLVLTRGAIPAGDYVITSLQPI